MTILCEPDEHRAAELLAALPGVVQTVPSLPDLAMAVAMDPSERLVVIGADMELSAVLSFSDRLRDECPDAAVVLLRDEPDPALRDQASRAGVAEIAPAGSAAELAAACDRARAAVATRVPPVAMADEIPQRRTRIVTVFSAKGGTGKTTVATNLAVALHSAGAGTVCLVDLDLAFGDVAITMQLTPRRTLIDAVGSGSSITTQLPDLVTTYRPGLDCVLAPVEPGDAERIPAETVAELLAALRGRYDVVVVDTPSQLSEHVLAALDASDHQLLLATPEIPSLKNLRLTLDMLDLLGYPQAVRTVVLNRDDERGGLSRPDVEQALRAEVAHRVPHSSDVPASINRGVPLAASAPDHPVSRAVTGYAIGVVVPDIAARSAQRRGLRLRKRSR